MGSTPSVLSAGNRLKVVRVYARPDAAKMIEHQAIWNRAVFLLVHPAMGTNHLLSIYRPVLPIAIVEKLLPNPATSVVAAIFLHPSVGLPSLVTDAEPNRLPEHMTLLGIAALRDGSFTTTTAFTEGAHHSSASLIVANAGRW